MVNDHVVRIRVMTQLYPWHLRAHSGETFPVIAQNAVLTEVQLAEREPT
jgi:hypothetical protein